MAYYGHLDDYSLSLVSCLDKQLTELELGRMKRGSDLDPDLGDKSPLVSFFIDVVVGKSSECPFVIFGVPGSVAVGMGPL